MKNFLNYKLNYKTIFLLIMGAFVIITIPLLLCASYNVSSWDDYSYGIYTHAAWISTHSLLEVFKAAIH